jgi:dihydropteroate synthase
LTASVYLHPIAYTAGPQSDEGHVIQLAGSMVYADRFALVLRENGKVANRWTFGVRQADQMLREPGDTLTHEAQRQWHNFQLKHGPLELGDRVIRLDQPQIMGVLNVTPDSFSDGGEFLDKEEAGRRHAAEMMGAGAALIDIGGESTRPGGPATWEGDEIDRIAPAVDYCAAMGAAISIDTRRASVLTAGLERGAHMLNDVSAMRYDPAMLELVASAAIPVVLMHSPGRGDDVHAMDSVTGGKYRDVVSDVFDALKGARDRAIEGGVAERNIIIDPGIGFGKSLNDNLALMNALPLFHGLGSPILVGLSRKRMIGALSNEEDVTDRLGGSIALAVKSLDAGVHILRVHDVPETVQARNVWRGLRDASLTDFSQLPSDGGIE